MTISEKTGCTSLPVDVKSGHTREVTAFGVVTLTTGTRRSTITVHMTTW